MRLLEPDSTLRMWVCPKCHIHEHYSTIEGRRCINCGGRIERYWWPDEMILNPPNKEIRDRIQRLIQFAKDCDSGKKSLYKLLHCGPGDLLTAYVYQEIYDEGKKCQELLDEDGGKTRASFLP